MFWAQFTAILSALASNASCMATGLSQSSAVDSRQNMDYYHHITNTG
jgi:hypothetical protein